MATALRFKVISPQGELIASCKWPGQAFVLVRRAGAGAKIRHMEWGALWTEGGESPALMTEHEAVALIKRRIEEKRADHLADYERRYGKPLFPATRKLMEEGKRIDDAISDVAKS